MLTVPLSLSLRVGAGLIGTILVAAFLRSVFRVAVINRESGDWLAHYICRLIHTVLARWALTRRSYADIQDVLAWGLPLYIVLLILTWFGLVQAGFSLLIWSCQAEHSSLQAVIASGSALSTLGFLTPPDIAGQLLAILEGGMGLGIIVFYFTFIPGYQVTIELRQAKVAWLYARGDLCLTNFILVEWFFLCGSSDCNEQWGGWEAWFRNLAETHVLTPILALVPSVHRGQTWLAAAADALDSAALCLSAIETKELPSAQVCFHAGVDALRLLAARLHSGRGARGSLKERSLTRREFDAACDRLATLGADCKPNRDVCWLRFAELRGEYEAFLLSLAESLLVPVPGSLLLPLAASADAASAERRRRP